MIHTKKEFDAVVESFISDLDKWLKTDDHLHNCTAYSEGQSCCLDKEENTLSPGKGRKFILKWMNENL